ncbi:MAG: Lrp/AsnC family transcriptional regulator [Candidatus Micrarchaeota archaeon]
MYELDLTDRKILYELDRNSRQTYSKLGQKLRTKKEKVKYRIDKLIREGIIEGFYTVIDYSKLGFISFRFYFQISGMPEEKKEEMIKYLKNHNKIWIFYRITGLYNFSFSIWVSDIYEYEMFWNGFMQLFGAYISDSHLALKTHYTEFSRNYLVNKADDKMQFTVLQKSEKEDLSKIDYKILNLLSVNARVTLVEMAKAIGTSIVTCRSHLRRLIKKKVIVGFRLMLNYEKLGYHYYKVDLWFNGMEKQKQVMQKVLSHPNVIYTEKTLVTSHFEFDLEVKDFREFIQIMDEFEREFPGMIKRYIYYSLIKNYKINYLPSV